MAVLQVPDPALVVLVGPAGVGKSTFAARAFDASEILSSDAFRAAISGSEADQRATRAAFAALHRTLESRLAEGRLTVVDATSVEPAARRALAARARAAGVPAIAIVLALPAEVVRARNRGRTGRRVPDAIVTRHLARLGRVADDGGAALLDEGFAAVHAVRTAAELDALAIVRGPRPGPRATP